MRTKDEGLVRFIGVTGHGVTVAAQHLRSLGEYPFDSVLLPYNYPMSRNTAYMEDFEALVEVCEQRGVAIKRSRPSLGRPGASGSRTANTWYEPLTDQAAIDLAVSWVLGRAGFFLNTVGDIHVLPKVLEAAERSPSASDEAMDELNKAFGLEPLFV